MTQLFSTAALTLITPHNLGALALRLEHLIGRVIEHSRPADDPGTAFQTTTVLDCRYLDTVCCLRGRDDRHRPVTVSFYCGDEVRWYDDGSLEHRSGGRTVYLTPVA